MGVIGPDLTIGMEWICGDANDEGGDPIGFTGEIAIIDGIDGCGADGGAGEDVDAGVAMADAVGFIPKAEDDTICGELEGGVVAGAFGGEGDGSEILFAFEPATIVGPTGGIGGAAEIAGDGKKAGNNEEEQDAGTKDDDGGKTFFLIQ